MIEALLVCGDRTRLSELEAVFSENDVAAAWAASGTEAVKKAGNRSFDLIVADDDLSDMTGLELAEKAIMKNPMHNVAVVSTLSHEDFHTVSEGLGILMQLPPRPGRQDAAKLLEYLKRILELTGKAV